MQKQIEKIPSLSVIELQTFAVKEKLCPNNGDAFNKQHPAKIDLSKKWLPKQKTIQNFNIDTQGFRKTRNEHPPRPKIGVTS